jgi:hypothetical protein
MKKKRERCSSYVLSRTPHKTQFGKLQKYIHIYASIPRRVAEAFQIICNYVYQYLALKNTADMTGVKPLVAFNDIFGRSRFFFSRREKRHLPPMLYSEGMAEASQIFLRDTHV